MKRLFQFLFRKRLTRHPDSFALTRKALWNSIAESIQLQQSMGKSVWLVAHFLETFTACQEMLERSGIQYVVDMEPVTEYSFRKQAEDITGEESANQVRLLLANLANPLLVDPDDKESSIRVAIMVVERHPFGPADESLEAFASSLPAKVELGYFLSLDDEIVRRMVPPQMIDLLKAMGLQEQDLISSSMVTKRLKKLIERESRTGNRKMVAESASQWFELNDDST